MDQILSQLNNRSSVIEYNDYVIEIICQRNNGSQAFSKFQDANSLDFSFTILLLDMSIILILSQMMRFLLKPLKQPKVICDILAGIILGPSVLVHNDNFAKNILPENSKFLIHNIGVIGFMFFLFVTGVKMDLSVVTKAENKHWIITIGGLVIPYIITLLVEISIHDYIDPDIKRHAHVGGIISAIILTTFPVTYSILRDMNLLSSEIGRISLTTVILSDLVGLSDLMVLEAQKQGEIKKIYMFYYFFTVIVISGIVVNGVPKVMQYIKTQTPAGKPMDKNYVITTFLGVFVIGFFTDFVGAAIGNGPFWLGIAIPDGPPIGATIVNKSEVLMNDILMPFSYALIGLKTDVFAMSACWSCLTPMCILVIMAYVSKFISVVISARFTNMSYKDSLVMGFMLSLRGQTEFLLYLHWMDLKLIKTPTFSLLVILTIIMTSLATPIIDFLYDPTRPYMINKKRTIQHTVQKSELRILACIYDQESVANLFNFLDFANPTPSDPFTIFALHLIELQGRAAPMIIDHEKQSNEYWDDNNKAVHNAIKVYKEALLDCLTVNTLTSVTPQRTMYQDICEIALLNKASFIILPFHKKCIEDGIEFSSAIIRPGVQLANASTFFHAPCSVGILACKNVSMWETLPTHTTNHTQRQFAMLFLGGPDAREALTLAGRMVDHPDVSLIVVRFLESEYKGNDESERKLDDGVVTWFWMKNERNDKVMYKEVVVSNGFEMVSVLHSVNDSFPIDLWIIGRKNGINPTLMEVLSEWSDNIELGLVGDFLVSDDFNTSGSVLVVQQQVLRHQRTIS